jgi:cold shock CspA family protein
MLHFLYGLMARDNGGKDVFVLSPRVTDRASAFWTRDKLSLSMYVEGRKGLEAARVRLV